MLENLRDIVLIHGACAACDVRACQLAAYNDVEVHWGTPLSSGACHGSSVETEVVCYVAAFPCMALLIAVVGTGGGSTRRGFEHRLPD